jgi:hypothetical protein
MGPCKIHAMSSADQNSLTRSEPTHQQNHKQKSITFAFYSMGLVVTSQFRSKTTKLANAMEEDSDAMLDDSPPFPLFSDGEADSDDES